MKKMYSFILIMVFMLLFACNPQSESDLQSDELKIDFEKYTLPNGLDVVFNIDRSDPIVTLTIMYHVGSGSEVPGKTGFAHLFEHIMFSGSENIKEGQFDILIQNAGGFNNGFTNYDATTYFISIPKNALEKIIWIESDRLGFLKNAFTNKLFNVQQNVVQNEKRQRVDNRPYGHTSAVIAKYLYPKSHPYSWSVIGEMEDLRKATVEDAKAFHEKFYIPNNATLVISGDFDVQKTKQWIEKYFGEINKGINPKIPKIQLVTLDSIKKVYHEDNFAQTAQLTMVWPTVQEYADDSYPLLYLAELLSTGKKAPLYTVLEKEKKLTSQKLAYNDSRAIAGEFVINITANDGIKLSDVENSVFEAFQKFEKESFTNNDVERIKAVLETNFYNQINSTLYKSIQLAYYNEFTNDPGFYKTDIHKLKSVTKEDILRVYEKYIKAKPYLAVSFVPKGKLDFTAKNSIKADITEENVSNASQVKIDDETSKVIEKTPSSFDRSVMPTDEPNPTLNLPVVWDSKLTNGMVVYGIEQNELPLIQFNIILKGGHYLDSKEKAGAASLVSKVMMQGTKTKTPVELEEAINKLGARIDLITSNDAITMNVKCLSRTYDSVMVLVKEILLEPRWDKEEFDLAKTSVINDLKRRNSDPVSLADIAFSKLVYGENHILSIDLIGNLKTVEEITLDDLKGYYEKWFSPSCASFIIAGKIKQENVLQSLKFLEENWKSKDIKFPKYEMSQGLEKSQIFFVDMPGAKQSIIRIGYKGFASTDNEFSTATIINYRLGGSFTSFVNQILREQKGFTYGASTRFVGNYFSGYFVAYSAVRSSATLESIEIFKTQMEKYREGISVEDLDFIKNDIVKSKALSFETHEALIGMLTNIALYNYPKNYIKTEEKTVKELTMKKHKELAIKYIDPSKMYYVIVGDSASQFKLLEKLGLGKPQIIKL